MNLELAKLFANLGFKYDRTALNQFRKDLNDLAKNVKRTSHNASVDIGGVNASLQRGAHSADVFTRRITSSYSKVKPSLEKMKNDLEKINRRLDSGKLNPKQTKVYEDLHERVLASIQREERRRLTAIERAREATRRAQEAEAKRDARLARNRQAEADRQARNRAKEVRERLREVLARKRAEEQAERERHRQATRNIREEGRLGRKSANQYRRRLTAIGAGLGALGGIYSLKESTQEYQKYQGVMSGLTAATGSAEKAQKDFEWLGQLSSRLGVFVGDTTKGYTSLAANTRNAGIDEDTTKGVFEGILSYGRVLNLSKDDTDGVLRALSQMVGKGKLNAEEVRQQAGERLPGFVPAAARAMGFGEGEKGTAKFFQEMQAGHLTAKQLFPNLAKELMNMANSGDALTKAMQSTGAAIGRLKTNVWMANKTFNEAGFDKTVRNLTNTLSDSVSKMDGVWKALGQISTIFGTALETPIEIIGTLSEGIRDLFKSNPQLKQQAKYFAAAITLAFAPLRKLFAALWVVPAGVSALNDLIQSWRKGDLGQKSWKELGLEVGLAGASLVLMGTTLFKMVNKILKALKLAKGLSSSMGGINQAGNTTGGGGVFGRGQRGSSTPPANPNGPRYGEPAGRPNPSSSRVGNTGRFLGTTAGAALVVGSSLIPEKADDGTPNSTFDYAQKTVTSGAQGALAGSWFGPYGALIGGAVGTGWGIGRTVGEDAGNAVGDQMDSVVELGLAAHKLYQSIGTVTETKERIAASVKNLYDDASNWFKKPSDKESPLQPEGLNQPNTSSSNPANSQLGGIDNDPLSINSLLKNLKTAPQIGTQYNGPQIQKIEINVNGGNQEEVRFTIEDILKGHVRSASTAVPLTEY